MKVFISWSGNKSHKVAMVLRDWLPSVIQTIEPYVSSEDIDKGARWSTDIAKELENSTFGILCVTKDNMNAPWLTFEAGALSKTMDKSFVSPFLFDIKRSEVDGPILQFQSTIFQKADIKKLLKTLNKACGNSNITETRLNKAFDVWYPTLEEELEKLKKESDDQPKEKKESSSETSYSSEILEEILELARSNQKLLRSPDNQIINTIEEIRMILQENSSRIERFIEPSMDLMIAKKFHPMMFDEILHLTSKKKNNRFGALIVLSFFRKDFPWLYDSGKELIDILKTNCAKSEKNAAIEDFKNLMEFSFEHPIMRESYRHDEKSRIYMREIPGMLMRFFESTI